jgi:hypothetical protein
MDEQAKKDIIRDNKRRAVAKWRLKNVDLNKERNTVYMRKHLNKQTTKDRNNTYSKGRYNWLKISQTFRDISI